MLCFIVQLPQFSTLRVNIRGSSSADTDDTTQFTPLALVHLFLSLTMVYLIPIMLYKFVLPSMDIKSCKNSIKESLRNSLFWGFVVSSILGLLVIIAYNISIIGVVSKISVWFFVLPVPISLVSLIITDTLAVILLSRIANQYNNKIRVLVIVMTLFVQMMSYHSGWIILLLITYPLQVGTLILMFLNALHFIRVLLCTYVSIIESIAQPSMVI